MLNASYHPARLLVPLALSFALIGCGGKPSPAAEDAPKEEKKEEVLPTPVELATVRTGDISAIYTGTATLEADGEAMVMAKVGGELVALLVNEGDRVEAGQPVARLDGDRLALEVKRAKANLEKTRQEYERNVELHQKGLLPAGTYEGLKYDLDALKAAYELARLELSYTTVRAPIAGIISERMVKAGNTVNASQGIFAVTDLEPLLAYLYVPERQFSKLKKGQGVVMTVDALPNQSFEGRVQLISPVIDPTTATFKVTAEINDASEQLKPGMFGRVHVEFDTHQNVPLVPRVALLNTDTESAVFVVEDGVAKRRPIRVGYTSNGDIEVTDGLSAGEQVVVIGQNSLKQDALVHVIPPGESVAKIKPKKQDDE
ncbi:MAG: efflux RND transporter periplasmic adaptor subunit [Gammaproteobacteria bacterium]